MFAEPEAVCVNWLSNQISGAQVWSLESRESIGEIQVEGPGLES